jgi:hypothetical protein
MSPKARKIYGHITEDAKQHGYWMQAARDATKAESYLPAWLPAKISDMLGFKRARYRDDTQKLVAHLKAELGSQFTNVSDPDWTDISSRLFQDSR